jgi:hypothetical protein
MPRHALLPFLVAALAIAGCGNGTSSAGGSADSGSGGSSDASSPDVETAADAASLPDSDASASPPADAASDAPGQVPEASAPVDAHTPDATDGSADDGATACPAPPVGGLYATFTVGADVFHASITNAAGIAGALALWHGTSTASIPDGKLKCTPASYNCPWHWQMDPTTIVFADTTIELCDGTPSYVETNCASFGGGSYCPWAAAMTELRDCRTDASCPAMAK